MDPHTSTHVLIEGVVQGVGFRDHTAQEAKRRGLSGWVRNLADGRVEGRFEGSASAVDALVAWCQSGPPQARVERIERRNLPPRGTFVGFTVRASAALAEADAAEGKST